MATEGAPHRAVFTREGHMRCFLRAPICSRFILYSHVNTSCRLAYLELCQLIQLLRSELQAPQIAQVAKDFIVFAFECAGRSSIGNPEDEFLEFQDFCSVAKAIPGISHILSIDVSEAFNSEKARILEHLKKSEDSQGSKSSAEKIVMKET